MARRNVKVRLHHFQMPCWFSFVDSLESFEDIKKSLLKDLKENGFKHFRKEEIEIQNDNIRDESNWNLDTGGEG